jgi:hypothetical protein
MLKSKSKKHFFMKIKSEKGFFSFIIVILIIGIILTITINLNSVNQKLLETKNELIKTEISQKERTLLENNVDKIIEIKLREQILLKNYNSYKIQNEINSKLLKYLQNRSNSCDTLTNQKENLSINFLNNNTTAYVIQTENASFGEYTFTSNLTKTNIVCKELGDKTKIEFRIPAGYNTKIID